eukprot:411185-Pleurochrysis_carterae.AAC.2
MKINTPLESQKCCCKCRLRWNEHDRGEHPRLLRLGTPATPNLASSVVLLASRRRAPHRLLSPLARRGRGAAHYTPTSRNV